MREYKTLIRLKEAWNEFRSLEPAHPEDEDEFRRAIHAAENIVLSRLGQRWMEHCVIPPGKNPLQVVEDGPPEHPDSRGSKPMMPKDIEHEVLMDFGEGDIPFVPKKDVADTMNDLIEIAAETAIPTHCGAGTPQPERVRDYILNALIEYRREKSGE